MRLYRYFPSFIIAVVVAIISLAAAVDCISEDLYSCYKDLNGDGVYDATGEVGLCSTTTTTADAVQLMICHLDATDCIIPSTAPAGTCPSLTDISYDAVTNQCCVPPKCQTNYSYDSSLGKCIYKSNGTCPALSTQDPTTGICSSTPHCDSPAVYSTTWLQCITTSAVICPINSVIDLDHDLCVANFSCPPNTTYKSTSNKCVNDTSGALAEPICPAQLTLNTTTNRCDADPPCSLQYDSALKQCIDAMTAAKCDADGIYDTITGMCKSAPTCPANTGQVYDSLSGKCVVTASAFCPTNGTFNRANNRCEAPQGCTTGSSEVTTDDMCLNTGPATTPPTCPTGTSFDSSSNECLTNAQCVASTSLNASSNNCESAPSCPTGTTYDSTTNLCTVVPPYTSASCAPGTTLDIPNGRCYKALPPCAWPSYYNAWMDKCVYPDVNACGAATGTYNTYSSFSCVATLTNYFYQPIWYPAYGLCVSNVCANPDLDGIALVIYSSTAYSCQAQWVSQPYDGYFMNYNTAIGPYCDIYANNPLTWPTGYGYALNPNDGYYRRAGYAVFCQIPTTFNGSRDRCEVAPTCPIGYTFSTTATSQASACVNYGTAPPICPSGTVFNGTTDRCEATPTCISGTAYNSSLHKCAVLPTCPTNFTFNGTSHTCESTERVCPLDNSLPCQNYNSKKMCSQLPCLSLSSASTTTILDPDSPTDSQTNDGTVDSNGDCNGQLIIFAGKPEYCRPAGLSTFGSDCCSSAHPGKFSQEEDCNTSLNDSVGSYKDTIDAYLTNDGSNINIEQRNAGYQQTSSPPNQTIPVVDGGPSTDFSLRRSSDYPEPTLNYSSVTQGGLTTVTTTYKSCLNAENEEPNCENLCSGSFVSSATSDPSMWNYQMRDKWLTCLNKGMSQSDCTNSSPFNYIELTQTYGNYTNDVHLEYNSLDTFSAATVPIFNIDTNAGSCNVVGNYNNSNCQFVCGTTQSGSDLMITVSYVYIPSNEVIETVAQVTKGSSGTSAQVMQQVYNICQTYSDLGQTYYTLGVKPPQIIASTSVAQNNVSKNMTALHVEWMPQVDNVWDQVMLMVDVWLGKAFNWLTSPCKTHELTTDTDRDAGKCHDVGSWCITDYFGYCTQRKTGYCCFGSKFARIIQEQGRPQIARFGADGGWGMASSPQCSGFTPEEFAMLDFSQMDMTEIFADIVEPIATDIANQVSSSINSYYNNTTSQSN